MFALGVQAADPPANGLLREVYEGIGGVSVSDLTSAPIFPGSPTSSNYVTDLFEAPTDVLDNYGERLHGYIVAPKSGSYTFWIASDDGSSLLLGTDENPATAREIATVASWTASREWGKEPNQQSAPIPLVAGRTYYVSALMKEGGGGDNLAVRWLMPDGTDQAPIVATNLLPFGVSFAAPTIARQPANTTAVEGGTVGFDVKLTSVGIYTYQWQRNGAAIAGATQPMLSYAPVLMSDNQARFRCVITNKLGAVTSAEAVLTVAPDTTRPSLVAIQNLGTTQLEVTFSEGVAAGSVSVAANFQLSGGVTVTAAAAGANPSTVLLTTTAMTLGQVYTLTVNGITDRAQAPNPITANSKLTFTAVEYAPTDIGAPPLAGRSTPAAGGVDVQGSGDFGGPTDSFQFGWQKRTGDFDLRTRLTDFGSTDPFAKAGLMARESLDPGSRFAAAVATPAGVGCFFMARTSADTAANRAGFLPANYPETWLRLKRVGNVFTAYASLDGQAWVALGDTTLPLSTTVYLGFAVASRNSGTVATGSFRDLGAPANATLTTYSPRGERLGPSSRQTPLIISEIMYHPHERGDGKDGEFIEIYNADLIAQDLSGYRISGSVEFAFPEGFVLPAGAFTVIARNPADFGVVYGVGGALGPFAGTNSLPNDVGMVRLRNPRGGILLEVNYGSRAPWPVSPDGGGHSLVLTRPSYGEADPRAWAASDLVGGSPGGMEAVRPNPLGNVLINEFLAHTDDPQMDYVELYNHSNSSVNVSGCVITDDPGTNRFRIPSGTIIPARGFVAFDQNQLGFRLNAAGESIFLLNPSLTRVLDAIRFGGQENGVASGRYPDGTAEIRRLLTPTPAAENSPFRVSEIVINEIMHNPISRDIDDEFVELHNRTTQSVDLAGWRFTDGIDFRFPVGAKLPAGGYLVVAKNRARLLGNYAGIDAGIVFGDFDGTLANGGERLALAKPDLIVTTNDFGLRETNRIYIDVDDVVFAAGGRWPEWNDGLGSSLELVDPDSDHLRPSNWAASDESAKARWGTIEFTGRLDNGDGNPADRVQIMLQGEGECLVDDVEVLPSGGANRINNPGFESGLTGWNIQGNHRASTLESTGGVGNSRCLHLRTTGRGDTAVNRIYAPLTSALANNSTATLRAKVRWLKGWPEFMVRLHGSYLEASGRMPLPTNLGTPGAKNSRAVANAGPAIVDLVHSPILPAGGQVVTVTARATDPDGIGSVLLKYRVDPGTSVRNVVMRDDGTGGDAVAGDGVYAGQIPGQSPNAMVAFHVVSTDAATTGASTALFPSDAPSRECLVRWGETQPFGNLSVYRLWQRQADYDRLRNREPMANDNLDCTFVYDDGRVIYNAQMRGKGSPWHGGSVGGDYLYAFPEDDRFLGAQDVALVTLGNLGSDDSAQREQAAFWIGKQMGLPSLHRRHVYFFENGAQKQTVYEDSEEPNGFYADRAWPDGQDGDLYKIEDWFEWNDAGNSFTFSRDATLEKFTTTGGSLKTARYRWAWRKRAVVDSANNYTNLFDLVTAVNSTGAAFVPQVENIVDMKNWMGVFALQHIVGNWDSYGYSRGKNSYIYKPANGRFGMVPWDIDFVLGSSSDGPTADIFGSNDPVVGKLWNTPAFRRTYLWAVLDACNGPLQTTQISPILDGRFAALTANGVNVANPQAIKNWISQRRTYLLNRVASEDTPTFAIASNNGADFNTNKTLISISGSAPIAVETIRVNGTPVPVQWDAVTGWTMMLALGSRTNALSLVGYDSRGKPVPGASDTITVRYIGAELPSAAGQVVINEIMYHPLVADASFVELYNNSLTAAFELSGWRLDGVDFTFPAGMVLRPGAYAVVAQNRAAFSAAYGFSVLPVGEFSGTLQNSGERVRLIKPGATPGQDLVVDQVRYDNESPWPVNADGWGSSLQLIDARQDNWRVGNWVTAGTNETVLATPGKSNSLLNTLPAFPLLFLNEVAAQNPAGATDRFGEHEPWIELYNAGSEALDLSGLYLTSDPTNLTQWPFPSGSMIAPKQFLVIWADGEAGESNASEWHTNFRLPPTNGFVALVRMQLGAPAVTDYLRYKEQPAGLTFGSYPDGQPQERQLFHLATPGVPNNPGTPPIQVFINEWMASNVGAVLDPADTDPDDWFELYNAGATPANLSAYTLTDVATNKAKFTIPNGVVIPAGGFLRVWADEETGQTTNGQLHANFRLAGSGEAIGLFTPDGREVDLVTFGPQTTNVSEGRFPDGMSAPFVLMVVPTPAQLNQFATANQPPVLAAIGSRVVDEGQTVTFTATASDADVGQNLKFELVGAPANASIQTISGLFAWTTTETDGPGAYSFIVRVTDNGVPPRSDSESITVTVREVNQAPTLQTIADLTVAESQSLVFTVQVADLDLPRQTLRFSLDAGAPAGAAINEVTGEFSWIPTEDQGPGVFPVTVRVTDGGQPAYSATRAFNVTVTEVDNAPVFQLVGLQTMAELTPFTLQLEARDPDSPPRAIVYALESGPSGLKLDKTTGLITWTPGESQGPNSYSVVARASEAQGTQSSTLSFSIVVKESNTAPTLAAIADRVVGEGSSITFTNVATDEDLPAQKLTFSLAPGAPAAASIDPATGVFSWPVGSDVGPSTNLIVVRVTDDALDAQTTSRSFTVVVQAEPRIVINEIMYHPTLAGTEFIELYNSSSNVTWSLAGWRLTGAEFTFPGGTTIEPDSYLVVAHDRVKFQAAHGTKATVVGNYTSQLAADGGTVRLIRPLAGAVETVVDEVQFSAGAPWPALANGGGASLQLIDPRQDNARLGNWAAVNGSTTNAPRTLVPMDATWRYWQEGTDPAVGWTNLSFDDSAWLAGRALLYAENAELPAPKNTALALGQMSYLFRTKFQFAGNLEGASLQLGMVIDDGAVFYLNGKPMHWFNMAEGEIPARSAVSTATVSDAIFEGPVVKPGDNLRVGENVLAVEVHQTNPGSSDVVFGCALDVIEVQRESVTPGYANSVRATLEPFPAVTLNEVLANNASGLKDAAGDRDPWIELVNSGAAPASLGGCYLANSLSNLTQWAFPAGANLPAGQFHLVWADGEGQESTMAEWHTNFRLTASAGLLLLTRVQNGQPVILDYLEYPGSTADQSFGYASPTVPGARPGLLGTPTPGAANVDAPAPPAPEIVGYAMTGEDHLILTFQAAKGRRYRLLAKDSLDDASWSGVVEVTATGSQAQLTDPAGLGQPHRFYRVLLLP